jgi:hypothetical protein
MVGPERAEKLLATGMKNQQDAARSKGKGVIDAALRRPKRTKIAPRGQGKLTVCPALIKNVFRENQAN